MVNSEKFLKSLLEENRGNNSQQGSYVELL